MKATFGHYFICIHLRIKVQLHRSNASAKPPVPVPPCREFPWAETVTCRFFSAYSKRYGDYGHPIVCGRSSHVLFLMSPFLKAYSLYLFADRSLMGFWGGKVSVVCWCLRLIRIVKLERVGWSLVAQELFHKYQNPPPSSLNILQLHQWLYHIKDSWDIPVSHLIPRWYRFHVALEPPC